jgi:hypothetical protein
MVKKNHIFFAFTVCSFPSNWDHVIKVKKGKKKLGHRVKTGIFFRSGGIWLGLVRLTINTLISFLKSEIQTFRTLNITFTTKKREPIQGNRNNITENGNPKSYRL